MKKLYEKLLSEYRSVLSELNIGYPLSEAPIRNLIELIQTIDYMKSGYPNKKGIKIVVRKYVQ